MTNGTDSGGRKRGLFARLFRRREVEETVETGAPAPPPAISDPPPPPAGDEEEDELLLGPAQMAVPPEPSVPAEDATAAEDDDEDALPLHPTPPGAGLEGGRADTPAATEAEESVTPNGPAPEEEEAILARLRAAGVGEGTVANTTAEDYVLPEESEEGAAAPETSRGPAPMPEPETPEPRPGAFAPGWLDQAEDGRREASVFAFDPDRARASSDDGDHGDHGDESADPATDDAAAERAAPAPEEGATPVSLFPGADRPEARQRAPDEAAGTPTTPEEQAAPAPDPVGGGIGEEDKTEWPQPEEPQAGESRADEPRADEPRADESRADDSQGEEQQAWHHPAAPAPFAADPDQPHGSRSEADDATGSDAPAEPEDDFQALTAALRAAEERDASAPDPVPEMGDAAEGEGPDRGAPDRGAPDRERSAWDAPEEDTGPAEESQAAAAADEATEAATPDDPAFEAAVRQLIRAEMEGELGKRLSANIRRMIHEEVASALRRRG